MGLKPHGKAGYHVMQLKIRWCYPYDFDSLCHDLFWQLYFWLASSLERSLFELPRDRNVRTGNKLRVLDCLLECSTKIKVTGTLQRDLSCKHIAYADWIHICSGTGRWGYPFESPMNTYDKKNEFRMPMKWSLVSWWSYFRDYLS